MGKEVGSSRKPQAGYLGCSARIVLGVGIAIFRSAYNSPHFFKPLSSPDSNIRTAAFDAHLATAQNDAQVIRSLAICQRFTSSSRTMYLLLIARFDLPP